MKFAQLMKYAASAGTVSLALVVLSGQASAAQTWQAHAGSGIGAGLVTVMKFYPDTITIDEGDSLSWNVEGDAHSIGFLSGAAAPDPFSPAAQLPTGGSTYDGTGIVSSGIITPGTNYTLTFTKAGTYQYNCLIHPGMMATVVVQPAGTPYPHPQRFYDHEYQIGKAQDVIGGVKLLAQQTPPRPTLNTDGSKNYSVNVGLGNGTTSIMRFFPGTRIIHVGDSITFTNRDPMMPHTVTFPGSDGQFQDIFTLLGAATYDGSTLTSSGILMANQTYTLTFTKAGRFNYECLLHDEIGMKGKIIVIQ